MLYLWHTLFLGTSATIDKSSMPEPTAMLLLGTGIIGLAGLACSNDS